MISTEGQSRVNHRYSTDHQAWR